MDRAIQTGGGAGCSVATAASLKELFIVTVAVLSGVTLPAEFGPWQNVWKRHRRFASDATWDWIYSRLLAEADAAGRIEWTVLVDSTINRAPSAPTNLPRATGGTSESRPR
jgi:transposase